jgi:hypothetical protein
MNAENGFVKNIISQKDENVRNANKNFQNNQNRRLFWGFKKNLDFVQIMLYNICVWLSVHPHKTSPLIAV